MEIRDVDFADFVYKVASSIADAQRKLDLGSAEIAKFLADTQVNIPKITKIIGEDGIISEQISREDFSLLELGITPTFYQFSETTIEVALDFKTEETAKGKVELKANTYSLRAERRLNKTTEAHSKFRTVLVPVPGPAGLDNRVEIIDKTKPVE